MYVFNDLYVLSRVKITHQQLNIWDCEVKLVFQLEGLTVDGQHKSVLPNLNEVELQYLENLESLCNGSIHVLGLHNLTTVIV